MGLRWEGEGGGGEGADSALMEPDPALSTSGKGIKKSKLGFKMMARSGLEYRW